MLDRLLRQVQLEFLLDLLMHMERLMLFVCTMNATELT